MSEYNIITTAFIIQTKNHRKLQRHQNTLLIPAMNFIINAKFGVTGLYDVEIGNVFQAREM